LHEKFALLNLDKTGKR